jgi:hypothetical protein
MGSKGNRTDGFNQSDDTARGRINHLFTESRCQRQVPHSNTNRDLGEFTREAHCVAIV